MKPVNDRAAAERTAEVIKTSSSANKEKPDLRARPDLLEPLEVTPISDEEINRDHIILGED